MLEKFFCRRNRVALNQGNPTLHSNAADNRNNASPKAKKDLTVALLGLEGSGKTTIANQLRNKSITDDYLEDPKTHQTFGITYDRLEFEFGYLNIIDLAGEEGFRNTWTSAIEESAILFFVIDISDSEKIIEALNCLNNILTTNKVDGKEIVIISNKADLEEGEKEHQKVSEWMDSFGTRLLIEYISISAKSGNSINILLKYLEDIYVDIK